MSSIIGQKDIRADQFSSLLAAPTTTCQTTTVLGQSKEYRFGDDGRVTCSGCPNSLADNCPTGFGCIGQYTCDDGFQKNRAICIDPSPVCNIDLVEG
jgi:hypothetical protein